jgi:riboflavin kinase/FMN adenylyltransferase
VALGNFDGVHRGHVAVIAAAVAAGPAPLLAAVFEPHPREHFQPGTEPFRLQDRGQRAAALGALGVQAVIEIGFTDALAQLSDSAFVDAYLANAMGVRHVAVGFDYTFGRGRMGDGARLRALGEQRGFGVSVVPALIADGVKVSSTLIRSHLRAGDMAAATALLGRPFAIAGPVITGFQRGRTIGFPTANQALSAYQRPRFGVYASLANVGDGLWRPAVSNCGVKPTVGGTDTPLLETHVFDFTGDLYGRRIEVALVDFLRPETKFDSFPALTAQIGRDADQARALLAHHSLKDLPCPAP